jgi:hypothetical protein
MVRKHRVPPWSMKDDRELIEFAAANLDDLAAHFNRSPAVIIKRGRRLGIYLKSGPHPKAATLTRKSLPPRGATQRR